MTLRTIFDTRMAMDLLMSYWTTCICHWSYCLQYVCLEPLNVLFVNHICWEAAGGWAYIVRLQHSETVGAPSCTLSLRRPDVNLEV